MRRKFNTANIPALLSRLAVGLIFPSEGLQKYITPIATGVGRFTKIGFSKPAFRAYFTGSVEIACGMLVLIGLLTQPAAIPLLIIMLVAFIPAKVPMHTGKGFGLLPMNTEPILL